MRRDYHSVNSIGISSGHGWGVVSVRPTTSFSQGLKGARPLEIIRWASVHTSLAEAEAVARAMNLEFFSKFPPFLEVEDPLEDFGFGSWSEFEREVRSAVGHDAIDAGLDGAVDEIELATSEIYVSSEDLAPVLRNTKMTFAEKASWIVEVSGYPPLFEVPAFGINSFREWRLLQYLASGERVANLCDTFDLVAFAVRRVEVIVDPAGGPKR